METFKLILKLLANMIMAGIAISIGAYVYLNNIGIHGAIMFSVGLMAVIHYNFFLFTGKIHAVNDVYSFVIALAILMFNLIGCYIMSLMINDNNIIDLCQQIVLDRSRMGIWNGILNGAGCGFIISLAVTSWKKTKLPLLIGIPAFITAGFTHSVADAFYYLVAWDHVTSAALMTYIGTVIGNLVGGLLFKTGWIGKLN